MPCLVALLLLYVVGAIVDVTVSHHLHVTTQSEVAPRLRRFSALREFQRPADPGSVARDSRWRDLERPGNLGSGPAGGKQREQLVLARRQAPPQREATTQECLACSSSYNK
jgi:hypothetical protein